jgi:outer membrane lipoprotein-sorting protein
VNPACRRHRTPDTVFRVFDKEVTLMSRFRVPFVLTVTVAAILSMHVGAAGADTSLQAVYDRMDQASTRFKGLKAEMKKVSHTDIIEIYYPKSNTVQEIDLGKSHKGMVESFVLLGFGSNSRDLQSAYTVRLLGAETVARQNTAHLELIPKSKEVADKFPKFELWIADESGIAVQQKMYETGGKDYSVATYTNMLVGPVSEADVKMNLPKGVIREYPQR